MDIQLPKSLYTECEPVRQILKVFHSEVTKDSYAKKIAVPAVVPHDPRWATQGGKRGPAVGPAASHRLCRGAYGDGL